MAVGVLVERTDVLGDGFGHAVLGLKDRAGLECVDSAVARLAPKPVDRVERVAVLEVVPVDSRRVEVCFAFAGRERDEPGPLGARACVVAEFGEDLACARAEPRVRRVRVGEFARGGCCLFKKCSVALAERARETDKSFGELGRRGVEPVQLAVCVNRLLVVRESRGGVGAEEFVRKR